jgi:hypothetical protein
MSLYKPLTEAEKQGVRLFDVRAISEDFIKTTCQPEYLKAKTPEGREFWTNQARKSKEKADRLLFNPETHCGECGEFLSSYGHCWQCHLPPMDPAQDAITQTTTVTTPTT